MDEPDDSLADEVSAGMHKVFFGEFDRLRKPERVPERLYHFCDTNAMASIIQYRTLWASLATCLNDASEVAFGLSRANSVIESKLATKTSGFLRHAKGYLNAATVRPYVTCFCGSADRALHWLHYGRSGSGVALGFDGGRLVQGDQFLLLPVSYDVTAFDARIHDVLAQFEQLIDRLKPEMVPSSTVAMEKFAAKLMAVLLSGMVASVKNPAFVAEEEWRLTCVEVDADWMPNDTLPSVPEKAMRVSGGRVVPYRQIEYAADSLPLTEIVLGHSCVVRPDDPGLSVLVRQCFKRELMPKVRLTDIPVR